MLRIALPGLALLHSLSCSVIAVRGLQDEAAGGPGGGSVSSSGAGASGGVGGACSDCDDDGQCEDLLTDPAHCGVCGYACPTTTCDRGSCVYYQQEDLFPMGISVDDTDVFFTGGATLVPAAVFKGDKATGNPGAYYPSGFPHWGLHVTSAHVYWAVEQLNAIGKIDKVTPPPLTPLPLLPTMLTVPIYVHGQGATVCFTGAAEVQCEIAMALLPEVAANAPGGVAVSGNMAYWPEADGDVIKNGMVLASGETTPLRGIAVHAGLVFFGASDRIRRVADAGGAAEDFSGPGIVEPFVLAADATHLYWTTWGDAWHMPCGPTRGRLYRRAFDGTVDEILYESVTGCPDGQVGFLALDGESVWFTDTFAGRVMKRSVAAPPP